jgi:hypothetical protein
MTLIVDLIDRKAPQILGQFGEELKKFPNGLNTVVAKALNSVATRTRNSAIKLLEDRYSVDKASIKKRISIPIKARPDDLRTIVMGKGQKISLYSFAHQIINVGNYKGVAVQVLRGKGPKVIRGQYKGGGFVQTGKYDNHLIYERRFPIFRKKNEGNKYKTHVIVALYGPSLISWFCDEENFAVLNDFADKKLPATLEKMAVNQLRKLGMML